VDRIDPEDPGRLSFMKTWLWIALGLVVVAGMLLLSGEIDLSGDAVTPDHGKLAMESGTYEVDGESYAAGVGTLHAPENRRHPGSRLIELPVIRLRATGPNPAEPVFLLTGGPGDPNIWEHPPVWLLENHDVVMVGYRGVDGAISLRLPEVAEALKSLQVFDDESARALGDAFFAGVTRLESEGVDFDGYTMVDVIDDLEAVRVGLGYDRINLYSMSYGTRLSYIYGLRYPHSIHRSLMGAINPPGRFVWEPADVAELLAHYGELWKNDPEAVAKSPDILQTMRDVLATLPAEWNGLPIMPDRVKFSAQFMLFHTSSAAQVFDAFVAAENGDYSGLAFLSLAIYNTIADAPTWGDYMPKGMTADFEVGRDYLADIAPEGSIIGSPGTMLWAGASMLDAPAFIAGEYRELRTSNVETLLVNGSADFSTPPGNAEELLPYLPNGELVLLSEMGHTRDIANLQPAAFRHLVETFYLEGLVDDSLFNDQAVNFTPDVTFQEMAQQVFAPPSE
jgi:pimeloyl-ACP methyl ester carboxylesterase